MLARRGLANRERLGEPQPDGGYVVIGLWRYFDNQDPFSLRHLPYANFTSNVHLSSASHL